MSQTFCTELYVSDYYNIPVCSTAYAYFVVVKGDTIRVTETRTPASASAAGNKGEICYDSDYVYVCTATNTWKRTALSTW